ncbi:hypothetical protein [Novosphingobium sp.]|uniref:hypothetical protein n=1 Tax=Novosphingobium sp. TaxID=1874826 RepID=UPI0025DFB099|nr:hypothetical protein [Novosphingobium sp.]MCC6925217.1 hypothetical protein [Novosphingobium sp.]
MTDNYWNLHRNSLIASSLLFLTSAKVISIDKMQFWQIQDAGHFVQICLLVVAVYTFSVYIANGRRQLRDNFELTTNQLGGDRENYSRMLEKIQQHMSEINIGNAECLAKIDNTLMQLKNIPISQSSQFLPEAVVGLFGEEIYEISNAISDPNFPQPSANPALSEIENQQHAERWRTGFSQRIHQFIEKIASKAYAYSANQVKNSIFPSIDILNSEFKAYIEGFRRISGEISDIARQHRQIDRDMRMNLALLKAESFVSGWQVPTAMIAISVAHFIGIYWAVLPSALSILDAFGLLRP